MDDPTTDSDAAEPKGQRRRNHGARKFGVGALLFVAALCTVLAVVVAWARDKVVPTESFVATADAVIEQPAVQQRIANEITTQVFAQQQVQEAIAEVIPERLAAFEGPIVSAAKSGLTQALLFVLGSQAFEKVFDGALTSMHEDLVNGQDLQLSLSDAQGLFGNGALAGRVSQVESLIPDKFTSITVLQKSQAPYLYQAFDLLQSVPAWLWIIALVLFALALVVSRDRRGTLMSGALTIAVLGLLLVLAGVVGRQIALGSLPAGANPDVFKSTLDIVVSGLRSSVIWTVVIAVVVAVVAFAWGRLGLVRAIRRAGSAASEKAHAASDRRAEARVAEGAGGDEAVPEPAPATHWRTALGERLAAFWHEWEVERRLAEAGVVVRRNLRAWNAGGVIAAAVLLLVWPTPTTKVVIWMVALAGVYLGVLQLLTGLADKRIPEVAEAVVVAPAPVAPEPAGTGLLDVSAEEAEGPPAEVLSQDERLDALMKLGKVRDAGILSDEEFEREKTRILGSVPVGTA